VEIQPPSQTPSCPDEGGRVGWTQAVREASSQAVLPDRVAGFAPDAWFQASLVMGKQVNGSFGCRFFVNPYQ
jgi:hypothetical protein